MAATAPMPASGRTVYVLGAGIVGIACALYLQRDGHQVTVIDRGAPGEGCSFGNAGLIETAHVTPLASFINLRRAPQMLFDPLGPVCIRWRYLPRLLPWMLRFSAAARPHVFARGVRALAALQERALDALRSLLDQAGARELLRTSGMLHVYESPKAFTADAHERALQREHGVRVVELSGPEVYERVPALSAGIERGVFFPDTSHVVDPFRVVQALARDFERRGGTLVRAQVADIIAADGRTVRLWTDQGQYEGNDVVVALGAWSGPLAARLGTPVPLDTERGYHAMLPQPGVTLSVPLSFAERRFNITPMEHGLRAAGTVEFGGLEAPPNYERARILVELAKKRLPGLNSTGYTQWMGFRPTLPDSLPVIGRSPRHANVYFAFGHHHLGLTLSAITGRLIADLVSGRRSDIDLSPYRIDRF